jgi:hypothetical protein
LDTQSYSNFDVKVDTIYIEKSAQSIGGGRQAIFSPDYPYIHVPFDDFQNMVGTLNTKLEQAT